MIEKSNKTPVVTYDECVEEAPISASISENRCYVYYSYLGNSKYLPINKIDIRDELPSGIYTCVWDKECGETVLKKETLCTDKIYNLPIKNLNLIKNDILSFWNKNEKFEEYGLIHKRGILLYGPPGCGKSCAIDIVISDLISKYNGIVYKISDADHLHDFQELFVNRIRIIEPERKILCIIEDIDGLFESDKSVQTKLLNLLDGINQTNHIVYMATTNYPENLAERILNRPSRFDKRYEFKLPTSDIRLSYLSSALSKKDKETIDIDDWVRKSKGLSLAHLRELIVSVIILGNDMENEFNVLIDMKHLPTSEKTNKVGFSSNGTGNGKVGFQSHKD